MTLCLIRSVREDRTLVACTAFINAVLGTEFTEPISYTI
jgi:dynein heavy chain